MNTLEQLAVLPQVRSAYVNHTTGTGEYVVSGRSILVIWTGEDNFLVFGDDLPTGVISGEEVMELF